MNESMLMDTSDLVYEIVDYIDEHYDEVINLRILSDTFFISTCYLSRVFKKVTGSTFSEYLNEVRILRAKEYLESSQYSITYISQICGYDSLTHFDKIFKKQTNQSPREYKLTVAC